MSKRVGIASLIWASTILLSRIIGLIREAVLGRTLGAGPEADVYHAAFIIPDWLNSRELNGLLDIIDPRFYDIEIPKYVVTASRDQFFQPDAPRYFWDDLVGPATLFGAVVQVVQHGVHAGLRYVGVVGQVPCGIDEPGLAEAPCAAAQQPAAERPVSS